MFTGLIEATGRIERVTPAGAGMAMRIAAPMSSELRTGDSVAVNGVCLTAAAIAGEAFDVEVSPETARVTTLGSWRAGRTVNLERPLRADARLGGHFVLGHVDGVGRVLGERPDGEFLWIDVAFPAELAPYLIPKGSVAVDGISLTIASLGPDRFGVQIVPFTRAHTNLAHTRPGDPVNLEVDVLGKYIVRLHELRGEPAGLAPGGRS